MISGQPDGRNEIRISRRRNEKAPRERNLAGRFFPPIATDLLPVQGVETVTSYLPVPPAEKEVAWIT
jgi:hypothetical protein